MGGYPPFYKPQFDLAQAQSNQDLPSATELASELWNISDTLNQQTGFLRAFATADRKLKPNTVVGSLLTVEARYEATENQTDFLYPAGTTVDPTLATVGVHAGGGRLDPSDVTVETDRVVIPAQTAGTIVVLDIHDNADSILSQLASTAANLGASLIGIEDFEGNYGADNVEDALAEVKLQIQDFIVAVGDLNKLIRSDGSVDFIADQSMGGFRLKSVANGTDPSDAVNLSQLNSVVDQLGNLNDRFLPRLGGGMFGNIAMNGRRITGLGAPAGGGDATNKDYVDGLVNASASNKLSLNGLKDSATNGTLTGPVTFGQLATDVADVDQTSAPTGVSVPTLSGIPTPQAEDQVANRKFVLDTFQAGIATGFQLGGRSLEGSSTVNVGGTYHFDDDITISGSFTLDNYLRMLVAGDVLWTATVTGSADPEHGIEIFAEGDVTITGPITVPNGDVIIEATGNIDIQAAIAVNGDKGKLRIKSGGTTTISAACNAETVEIEAIAGFTLSDAITARNYSSAAPSATTDGTDEDRTLVRYNVDLGRYAGGPGIGATGGSGGGGGGTGGGAGGNGQAGASGGAASPVYGCNRPYLFPLTLGAGGGRGNSGQAAGDGGGVIDIYCGGDADLASGTLKASGVNTATNIGGGGGAAGGGGGTIRIVVKGTLTGGTLDANGGSGENTTSADGGGGGGGGAYAVASTFAGTQTITANGGVTGGSGGTGQVGTVASDVLTSEQIQGLFDDGWFKPGKYVVTREAA